MKDFPRFNVGDAISAEKMNSLVDYAGVASSGVSAVQGTFFGSRTADATTEYTPPQPILVHAIDDFSFQITDHVTEDDCPSGLCQFVRLTRATNTHNNITGGRPFYVHDPVAGLMGTATKSTGDVFHAVWNRDSKRWEVLQASSVNLVTGVVRVCLDEGWHEVELTDWSEVPETGSTSTSSSTSASDTTPCDNCELVDDTDGCESIQEVDVYRNIGVPNGETVYAHTTNLKPMLVGGLIKMLKRATVPTSNSASTSVSDLIIEDRLYDVVDGVWPLLALPFPIYECCTDPITGVQTVEVVSCTRVVVEGYQCIGEATPCPTGSESV